MKYLVVLAVVAIAFWIWNSKRKDALRERRAAQAPRVPQATVRCAHCGVHVVRQEGVQHDGQWFCSKDHARRGARSPAEHSGASS